MILGEFQFLWKYGIIALYMIFTIVYICIIALMPDQARTTVATILIFTDPAAMGLFFMGAVVLFEKSQRVNSALGVAPITVSEYIIAKVTPMLLLAIVVSIILSSFAGGTNLILIPIGVAMASILLSLCGLMVGANIKSINSFIIVTVPFEIVISLPAILYLFEVLKSDWWRLLPGVAAIRLMDNPTRGVFLDILCLVAWILITFFYCKKMVTKALMTMGGASV